MSPTTTRPWLRPGGYAIVGLAVGLFLVLQLTLLVQVNSVTAEIRATQTGSRSLLDIVTDCTDPKGRCFRQQAARSAAQTGNVNATTVAAAFCAVHGHMDTYAEALRCINRVTKGKP